MRRIRMRESGVEAGVHERGRVTKIEMRETGGDEMMGIGIRVRVIGIGTTTEIEAETTEVIERMIGIVGDEFDVIPRTGAISKLPKIHMAVYICG